MAHIKIAIMSRWNATCGISLHAEIIGRKFIDMKHEVIIFAPTLGSADTNWHHKHLDIKDEVWVHRVYEETEEYFYPYGGKVDINEILKWDFDIFIVESHVRFPIYEFKKVVNKIKRKAPILLVLHLGYIRDVEPFMEIKWDAITVFDRRFIDEILVVFGSDIIKKVFEIPYPYVILNEVKPYRPDFAKGKILFITYGRQPLMEYLDYIRALRKLSQKYDIVYWIIRSDGKTPFNEEWIVEWNQRPDLKTIYSYVMGSEIHLLPKGETRAVALSSTLSQVLFTGTPTIVPNTRYFELIPVDKNGFGPVVKYTAGNTIELYKKIVTLIENDHLRRRVSKEAKKYALKYSDEIIAKKYLDLIENLLSEESAR